jgi:hypothetical protein
MCSGGRLLADFPVGTAEAPTGLPDVVARSLTRTVDGAWMIWASKVAWIEGDQFRALTGSVYPWDAVATCRCNEAHPAPDPDCTCGFHAVSDRGIGVLPFASPWRVPDPIGSVAIDRMRRRMSATSHPLPEPVLLSVALSGRVLAFEWIDGAVLFRAQRQTVARVHGAGTDEQRPDDPTGTLARTIPREPVGVGPVHLRLPTVPPEVVAVADDAGYCIAANARRTKTPASSLAST